MPNTVVTKKITKKYIDKEMKWKSKRRTRKNKPNTKEARFGGTDGQKYMAHRKPKDGRSPSFLVITWSINGLNSPSKRQRLAEWIRKHDLTTCCLQEINFRSKITDRLNMEGWKKIPWKL